MYAFDIIEKSIRRILFNLKNLQKGYMIDFDCT